MAHIALAEASRQAGTDQAAFVLPVQSVDKEHISIARVEDRLALLDQIAARLGLALALTNAGLYVDQARAFRKVLPKARLSFVTGYDKIVQILDPRYYQNRDAALQELFGLADVLVLPRGRHGAGEITELAARPENAPFANGIHSLPAPASLDLEMSATGIRAGTLTGGTLANAVPPEVLAFLNDWRPYGPESVRYHRRWELVEAWQQKGAVPSGTLLDLVPLESHTKST